MTRDLQILTCVPLRTFLRVFLLEPWFVCRRMAPNEGEFASLLARVADLERQVSVLSSRFDEFDPAHMGSQISSGQASARFKPVEPAACLNVKPCLRSGAVERIGAECLTSVWSGRWSVDPLVAGKTLRDKQGWLAQHFVPAAAQCEVADPFLLSPTWPHHVTVAQSQFINSRLKGVRGAVWLMIGTSIDHGIVYEVCVRFGRDGIHSTEAAPTRLYPRPGLRFNWCRLPLPFNLTLVEASVQGLSTRETGGIRIDAHVGPWAGLTGRD